MTAKGRARGRGDDWARDHGLWEAHDIESHDGAEEHEWEEIEDHLAAPWSANNSSSGTGRAAGTSCALTTTPQAANARSAASSDPSRKTYRNFGVRPGR